MLMIQAHYSAINEAIRKIAPMDIITYDNPKDATLHVKGAFRGEVFWHKVYAHCLVSAIPEGLIWHEVKEAGEVVWNNFLDSYDWTTYWEIPDAV